MSKHDKARYWLNKKARKHSHGYPLATIAYYGPTDRHASKVVVAILAKEDDITVMEKWFSEEGDIRQSPDVIGSWCASHLRR